MATKRIPYAPPGPARQCCYPGCTEDALFRLWPEDTEHWEDEYEECCAEHLPELLDPFHRSVVEVLEITE